MAIPALSKDLTFPEGRPAGARVAWLDPHLEGIGDVTYRITSQFQDELWYELPSSLEEVDNSNYWDFVGIGGEYVDVFSISGDYIVSNKKLSYGYADDRVYSISMHIDVIDASGAVVKDIFTSIDILDALYTAKGTAGNDRLVGTYGRDNLFGFSGSDKLFGKSGDDRLSGGLGADVLSGGLGSDTFVYRAIRESTVKAPDRITDFFHVEADVLRDYIDLSAVDADTKTAGNQDFSWIGADKFSRTAGELRYEARPNHALVLADVNGDGKADMAIRVLGLTQMHAGDFVL